MSVIDFQHVSAQQDQIILWENHRFRSIIWNKGSTAETYKSLQEDYEAFKTEISRYTTESSKAEEMINRVTDEQMTEYVQSTLKEWIQHIQKLRSLEEGHAGRLSEVEDWYERIDDIKALHSKFSSAKKVYNLRMAAKFALRRRQNLYEVQEAYHKEMFV
jgi:CHAD domain-containing protein